MKKTNFFLSLSIIFSLLGCDTRHVQPDSGSCSSTYAQTDKEYNAIITIIDKFEAKIGRTSKELMKISEDAAAYRADSHDLCHLFNNGRMTYEQYQKSKMENNEHFRKLKEITNKRINSINQSISDTTVSGDVTMNVGEKPSTEEKEPTVEAEPPTEEK